MSGKNWQKDKILASKSFQEVAATLVNELIIKERKGKRLILADDTELLDFVTCSYLGLEQDHRVIDAVKSCSYESGFTIPAARTRLRSSKFDVLEGYLNRIFCNSHSIIFPNVHLAHLSALPLLASGQLPSFQFFGREPVFILDKKVHASIQINRGLLSQFGEIVILDFNDHNKLHDAFRNAMNQRWVPIAICDGIGSMGGAMPVKFLTELADQYKGYVYFDDAHGTSIYGENGCGYVLDSLNNQFHPRMILTLSCAKAFGSVAGVLAMPTEADAIMVKRFGQTYIFSGPPPIASIEAAIASAKIHLSLELKHLQERLWGNVQFFDRMFKGNIINANAHSPIRGIHVGDELSCIRLSFGLQRSGVAVTTAMFPTVEKGGAMLRVALSAMHTHEDILCLANVYHRVKADVASTKVSLEADVVNA